MTKVVCERDENMDISENDKKYLISELEKLTGARPLFYLKFCAERQFAEDVCAGKLYANTPKYFREKEIVSVERGQGDRFELISIIEARGVTMFDIETNEVLMTAPKGTLRIQFLDDDSIPIVSFVGISLRDMKLIYADESHADFIFPFTDEEYDSMEKKFGKYCVMLNGKELEQHISNYCGSYGCEYIFDKIEYCEQNRIDRMQAFSRSAKERFLYKNSDLAYQREFRLAIAHEIPNDHFINIGCLTNTKIFMAEELKGIKLSIGYISHQNEDDV